MAPIQSKVAPPPPATPQEAKDLVAKKAKPVLDTLLDILQASLAAGGAVVTEVQYLLNQLGPQIDRFVHSTFRLLEDYCCLDLHKFARGPEPKLQGSMPILFVMMLVMMLYNAFVLAYMPAAGIAFNSPTSLLFHAFIFLVVSSLFQAASVDPGGVPPGPEWRRYGQPPPQVHEHKHGSEEARWCRKSEAYKPDRAHYCRVLKRVVLRMDHHCPWIGNTVGFGNHKFFFLFLLYAGAACGMLNISVIQLLVHATLPALTTFLLIGAEGLTLLLSMLLVPFFLFHCWLLARNVTTIEFCELMRNGWADTTGKTLGSPYDVGIYRNICSVLGNSPLLWFLPVGRAGGDGVSFPRRDDASSSSQVGSTAGVVLGFRGGATAPDAVDPEGDPEAAHPAQGSAAGAEMLEGATEEGWSGDASTQSEASLPGDGGGGVGGGCAEFLVWRSAAEFTDDVRVGCEVIGEASWDGIVRFLSLCATKDKRRRALGNKPAVRKSDLRSEVRFVRCRSNSIASTGSSAASKASAAKAFLSD